MYSIDTTAICEHCYRHIPARRFEDSGSIWIEKTCPDHGYTKYLVEPDADFYHSLVYEPEFYTSKGYGVDITERCNLTCPHCYQLPDNTVVDKSIDFIINELLESVPNDGVTWALAGAEPTMRKDLPELIRRMKDLEKDTTYLPREIRLITNGVLLERKELVHKLIDSGLDYVTLSLNHPTYQGLLTNKRQREGIKNCVSEGLKLGAIAHTLGHLGLLEDVLQIIQDLGTTAEEYRVRGGADIGRTNPLEPKKYLGDMVKEVKRICEKKGWDLEFYRADNNVYHIMARINGLEHRFVQWADATNFDLDQANHGPWCKFSEIPHVSNMMHQWILRDGLVNKKLPALDEIPERYRRMYQWEHGQQ